MRALNICPRCGKTVYRMAICIYYDGTVGYVNSCMTEDCIRRNSRETLYQTFKAVNLKELIGEQSPTTH